VEIANVEHAAQLFVDARRTGKRIRALPPECRPASTAEVNAIIDAVSRQIDEPVGGWKIGFVYSPRQKPVICPMYESRIFRSPARVPLALTPGLNIEPEISFRLTGDLPARTKPYKAAEVADAIVASPSLEIVDTRFDVSHRSIRQMLDDRTTRLEALADHNTCGAYIVGEGRPDWQDFDFAQMRMVMRTGDRVMVETVGGHAFLDPFLPCVVLANEMRHRGGMRAGQVLVTGSFCGFFPAEPDRPVTAEFVGFGSAEATFVTK
jgi:2-keto-4-pentenoate hydratase